MRLDVLNRSVVHLLLLTEDVASGPRSISRRSGDVVVAKDGAFGERVGRDMSILRRSR
jgi:hypothetical protein